VGSLWNQFQRSIGRIIHAYIEMNKNKYISDSLYTNKFLLVIDSRNATSYNNSTANSDLNFAFNTPIIVPKWALKLTCSVLAFTVPNSIYNINSYNNYIHMFYSNQSVEVKVYIPYGNYNSTTFITQFVASVLVVDTTLGTGLSITLNTVTNRFTVSPVKVYRLFMIRLFYKSKYIVCS
jgi:hypothetical protein